MSTTPERRIPEPLIDLSVVQRCHFIGVGGPGMSPIAKLLQARGHVVSGSDMRDSAVTQQLRSLGVEVSIGHDASLVHNVGVVTYSTAIPESNIELVEAQQLGKAVRHRSGMLASLCASSRAIGVAGTHGKTTSTALLALMLKAGDIDASVIIGAEVPGYGVGAHAGVSDVLLLEADESDGTLDVLPLHSLLVTNVDVDHLDYFGTFEHVQQCFADAAVRATGPIVLCLDDPGSAMAVAATQHRDNVVTFGVHPSATVRVHAIESNENGLVVDLVVEGEAYSCFVPLRGVHNAMNLAGAVAMAYAYDVPVDVACASVASFSGVARRFTERGEFNGAVLIDDYAHLPAEIEAAISAARTHPALSARVVAVFQPNRFHRIAAMADSYSDCFGAADLVVITDVYASGTPRIEGVTGKLVSDAISAAHSNLSVVWAQTRRDIVNTLQKYLQPGDVCISMGCGDIETLPDDLRSFAS
ncbi:MAG: UDP-N-acetylmuramate--L-alanine ligase [Actinomycetes bacterium]